MWFVIFLQLCSSNLISALMTRLKANRVRAEGPNVLSLFPEQNILSRLQNTTFIFKMGGFLEQVRSQF